MEFLELVNRRLDHVKAYNSASHYRDHRYLCKRWTKKWGDLMCGEITREMIEQHILERREVSAYTANQDLRYLKATFNFGKKKGLTQFNPTAGVDFFPVEKKVRYIPSSGDIDKVIEAADPDTKDYLWTIRDTMARVGEINRLTWDDVNLEGRFIVLYTRKKKGGDLTPRRVPMTQRLFEILSRRYSKRRKTIPWVFWHAYRTKDGKRVKGPYQDRKKIMESLCEAAGVKYFRFHPLRHSGASIMDGNNVPIGDIQRILGHQNRSTTEIYLHSIGLAERQAIAIYEKATGNSHTIHTQRAKSAQKKELTSVG